MGDRLMVHDGKLVPLITWRLALPEDASLGDVIRVLNDLRIQYTAADEADLFRQFGSNATYFKRLEQP
jgi:hypothetical protein